MDEHKVANHGNVAAAGRQVQSGALVVVPVVHLYVIAAQHEVHLHHTIWWKEGQDITASLLIIEQVWMT